MAQVAPIEITVQKDEGGNDELHLSNPSVELKPGDYVNWSADFKQIIEVRIDMSHNPFFDGGPWHGTFNESTGKCYPCPALPVTSKGTFPYSVCACVGPAKEHKSLVVDGKIHVR